MKETYKIYTYGNKLKKTYDKTKAFQLMSTMDIGDKFYFNVTDQTAKYWCLGYERKAWRVTWNENKDMTLRHLVRFEVKKGDDGSYIEKTEDRMVYTDVKHSHRYGDGLISINQANLSIRTFNALSLAGFRYINEFEGINFTKLYRLKNFGTKSVKELNAKLKEFNLKEMYH